MDWQEVSVGQHQRSQQAIWYTGGFRLHGIVFIQLKIRNVYEVLAKLVLPITRIAVLFYYGHWTMTVKSPNRAYEGKNTT